MGIAAYIWAGIILLGLFFVFGFMRNLRLFKTAGERTKRFVAWLDFRKWRRDRNKPEQPKDPNAPVDPSPIPGDRGGWFRRWRERRNKK